MSSITRPIPLDRSVSYETKITVLECANCNIDFGIGADFEKRRRDDHQTFYCPNGHGNVFKGPSEAEKRAERAERDAEWYRARSEAWKDQAEAAERARAAQKGANTKLRKRIAAGVCPCCHRSFQNLHRHMSGQHPDYAEDQP
jgi:hypothetical protein